MVDYVKLQQTADRLIDKNGRSITFVKLDETPADPSKPWNGPSGVPSEVQFSARGVFVPPNTVRQFGLTALGEGTEFKDLIDFSEEIIITAQGSQELKDFSSVLDRGTRWGIIGLQVLRPGDLQLLAFVGVRR